MLDDDSKFDWKDWLGLILMTVLLALVITAMGRYSASQPPAAQSICITKSWHNDYRASSDYFVTGSSQVFQVISAQVWGLLDVGQCYKVYTDYSGKIYKIEAASE